MGKYFREIDLSEKNSAHTKIINLVGSNKRILEFGCASGYMSKVLKEKFNCELVSEGRPVDVISEYHRVLIGKNGQQLGIEKREQGTSTQGYAQPVERAETIKAPFEARNNTKKMR